MIEKLESITYSEEHDIPLGRESTIEEITDKINEIIDVVNELEKIRQDNHDRLIRSVEV
jgi:hypothetical protein